MDRTAEKIERKKKLGRLRSKKYRVKKRLRTAHEKPSSEAARVSRYFDDEFDSRDSSGSSEDSPVNLELRCENLNITPNKAGVARQSDDKFDSRDGPDAGSSEVPSVNVELRSGDDERNVDINSFEGSNFEDNDIREASMDEDESEKLSEAEEFNETEALHNWALNSSLPHTRLEALLDILRKRLLPELPKCAKTFLGTSKISYNVQKFNEQLGSEFAYFGLAKTLENSINPELHEDDLIHLIINVDGLQLFKSSTRQFWPIMCKIYHDVDIYKPFPVAIYSGNKKPDNVQKYLENFIAEINILHENRIQVGDRVFQVCIKAFVCDTPARAFLKCVKGHGGYWACERCSIRGIREGGRIIYPDLDSEPRTDESFRQRSNPEHHNDTSPLLSLEPPVNMITSFLLDFMHLCCLGVMKKLLEYWLHSQSVNRLSHSSKNVLSTLLIRLQRQIPMEFQRTTRTLSETDRFKAVEFRFLLLYAGPVIFRKVLSESLYKHFLLLHTACRILCSKEYYLRYQHHAKLFLRKFVETAAGLYGKTFLIGNVHNLLHLADDVEYMRCPLSFVTAFPFENALGKIKKLLRSGNRPLSQICRRLGEIFLVDVKRPAMAQSIQILRQLPPDISSKILIKRLQYKEVTLTSKPPDNTVLLANGTIMEINSMYIPPNKDENDIELSGTILRKTKPLFTFPCESDKLKMWAVKRNNAIPITCKLSGVVQKMVTLDISEIGRENIYTMPLLHQ